MFSLTAVQVSPLDYSLHPIPSTITSKIADKMIEQWKIKH